MQVDLADAVFVMPTMKNDKHNVEHNVFIFICILFSLILFEQVRCDACGCYKAT
jgi:hypothetical protein